MRRIDLLALLLAIALQSTAEQKWDPVADPKAVVVEGAARFTLLTPRRRATISLRTSQQSATLALTHGAGAG